MFSLQTDCVVNAWGENGPDAPWNQEEAVSGSADRMVISGRLEQKQLYSVLINIDESVLHAHVIVYKHMIRINLV